MTRKRFFLFSIFLSLVLAVNSCSLKTPSSPKETPVTSSPVPQLGLNFIRFYFGSQSCFQPEQIFQDFSVLGIKIFRQLVKADVAWGNVEPKDNQWDFSISDQIILHANIEPVLTLFSNQYASPTPPWETDPHKFQKTLGEEAKDYLTHVVERYKDTVKYWEIGNEMEHWRAADPNNPREDLLPSCYPLDGFSPQEQGLFLAQAAALIKTLDPDAVILLPGLGGLDEYAINTWFKGVLEGGGSDWFDIVNYHYYGDWKPYFIRRKNLEQFLEQNHLAEKPVWNTETGSTSSATLTLRTNYPNSEETQAADVFRRIVQAWAAGDQLVNWHTYIGSKDTPNNDWRCYGIRAADGAIKPAYYSFKLLSRELTPFEKVEAIQQNPEGVNNYQFTCRGNAVKYVAWGTGDFRVPAEVKEVTSVLAAEDGRFSWKTVSQGETLHLSEIPILLK